MVCLIPQLIYPQSWSGRFGGERKKCLALVYTVLFVSEDKHITQCLTENGIVIFPT